MTIIRKFGFKADHNNKISLCKTVGKFFRLFNIKTAFKSKSKSTEQGRVDASSLSSSLRSPSTSKAKESSSSKAKESSSDRGRRMAQEFQDSGLRNQLNTLIRFLVYKNDGKIYEKQMEQIEKDLFGYIKSFYSSYENELENAIQEIEKDGENNQFFIEHPNVIPSLKVKLGLENVSCSTNTVIKENATHFSKSDGFFYELSLIYSEELTNWFNDYDLISDITETPFTHNGNEFNAIKNLKKWLTAQEEFTPEVLLSNVKLKKILAKNMVSDDEFVASIHAFINPNFNNRNLLLDVENIMLQLIENIVHQKLAIQDFDQNPKSQNQHNQTPDTELISML